MLYNINKKLRRKKTHTSSELISDLNLLGSASKLKRGVIEGTDG
jgi:hypothetical protein